MMDKDFHGDMVHVLLEENRQLKEQLAGNSQQFYRMPAEERYMQDPLFNGLVNAMFKLIAENQFTPTEMREACMQASIKYEMERGRNRYFDR
jgi:hypothetical protein